MDNQWMRLLAYVTGLVNQQLLLQNEYLVAENRVWSKYRNGFCSKRLRALREIGEMI
jgi:hypothetical protein